MNKQIEALKMAIEAVEYNLEWYNLGEPGIDKSEQAIEACKEALEETEKQEPVAVITPDNYGEPRLDFIGTFKYKATTALNPDIPLYTHPATWQSLNDDEIVWLCPPFYDEDNLIANEFGFARAIEQALKEKNHG